MEKKGGYERKSTMMPVTQDKNTKDLQGHILGNLNSPVSSAKYPLLKVLYKRQGFQDSNCGVIFHFRKLLLFANIPPANHFGEAVFSLFLIEANEQ